MIVGRLRLMRRARDLVEVVRDLRRVERAHVVMESGPLATPVIAGIGEREHASPVRLGG
ncbi:MAG: hypothetical protein H0T42_06685 [Deltaproteobacteria bacterium]|nr:hypothetical protein [Deltaproteobacteria bacterium]